LIIRVIDYRFENARAVTLTIDLAKFNFIGKISVKENSIGKGRRNTLARLAWLHLQFQIGVPA